MENIECQRCEQILKDKSIHNLDKNAAKKTFLKWSLRNHPDKLQSAASSDDELREITAKYQEVSDCYKLYEKDECDFKRDYSPRYAPPPRTPRYAPPPRAASPPRTYGFRTEFRPGFSSRTPGFVPPPTFRPGFSSRTSFGTRRPGAEYRYTEEAERQRRERFKKEQEEAERQRREEYIRTKREREIRLAEEERLRQQEALRQEAVRQEALRQEAERQEAIRQEAIRQESLRRETERQEAIRKEVLLQDAMRQEALRQEAQRQELLRQAREYLRPEVEGLVRQSREEQFELDRARCDQLLQQRNNLHQQDIQEATENCNRQKEELRTNATATCNAEKAQQAVESAQRQRLLQEEINRLEASIQAKQQKQILDTRIAVRKELDKRKTEQELARERERLLEEEIKNLERQIEERAQQERDSARNLAQLRLEMQKSRIKEEARLRTLEGEPMDVDPSDMIDSVTDYVNPDYVDPSDMIDSVTDYVSPLDPSDMIVEY
jgi:hypothetical protein